MKQAPLWSEQKALERSITEEPGPLNGHLARCLKKQQGHVGTATTSFSTVRGGSGPTFRARVSLGASWGATSAGSAALATRISTDRSMPTSLHGDRSELEAGAKLTQDGETCARNDVAISAAMIIDRVEF